MSSKQRLDKLLVEKKLVKSREEGQRYILAGKVLVNETKITKCGQKIDDESEIRITQYLKKYVSKGGEKLEIALKKFNLNLENKSMLDIGISTGGFTDCALKNKVSSVIGVDVGYGQVDLKIRNNEKVKLFERTNARYFEIDKIFDIITCDASFISIIKFMDVFLKHSNENTIFLILLKPQFEVLRKFIKKGGIVVRDRKVHISLMNRIYNEFEKNGLYIKNIAPILINLPKGNIEYVMYIIKNKCEKPDFEKIFSEIEKELNNNVRSK